MLRDPEDNAIRIQAIQIDISKLRYRLGDVLLLEVSVSADERAPEHLAFYVRKAVVVYRPPWLVYAWRVLRHIWRNRMRLDNALAANR